MKVEGILLFRFCKDLKKLLHNYSIFNTSRELFKLVLLKRIVIKMLSKFSLESRLLHAILMDEGYSDTGRNFISDKKALRI